VTSLVGRPLPRLDFVEALANPPPRSEEGYPGTEYVYPIAYGITGETRPTRRAIEVASAHVRDELGGYFLKALWLAELAEARHGATGSFAVSDDAFRRMCVGLNQGANGWALLLGAGDPATVTGLVERLRARRFTLFALAPLADRRDAVAALGPRDTGVVNASTAERTDGRVTRVFLHSIFQHQHTACSCFQNIAFYIPDVDGIALVHRGYPGVTPDGATWTTWANRIAGRQYPEGAASFAVAYMASRKFLEGDGGWDRVVWMTRTLKDAAGDAIPHHLRERIATEQDATTLEALKTYLAESHRR
jgi:hypothetical protein